MLHLFDLEDKPLDILDYLVFIFFLFLTLLIIFPWLKPGYILAKDLIVTPVWPVPPFTSSYFTKDFILHFLGLIIPTYAIQKIIIFLVFFMGMIGMYRLVIVKSLTAKIFASVLFVFNPFVYNRLVDGQWTLLSGYALLPFFLKAIIVFMRKPSSVVAFKTALILTLIGNFSTHLFLLSIFFIVVFLLFAVVYNRIETGTYWYLSVLLFFIFLFNINWLMPMVLGRSDEGSELSDFSRNDLIIFQSVGDEHFGLLFNILSGYGYWGERDSEFILPKEKVFFWPVISLVFIILFLWGFIKREKKYNDYFHVSLLFIFFVSVFLSVGIAGKSIREMIVFLYEKVPFLKGFREPQKLTGIIILAYSFYGSFAVEKITAKIKNKFIDISFILLPIIFTPTILFGAWGQLKPVHYPKAWSQINQFLNTDKDNFLTVFFPWHLYMKFSFNSSRITGNPAPYFFDKPVISSRNYETSLLASHDKRPEAQHIEGLLTIEKEGVNFLGEEVSEKLPWGDSLSPINVKYIILSKDDDWEEYKFLDRQSDLKKVYENGEIDLYQNIKWNIDEQTE